MFGTIFVYRQKTTFKMTKPLLLVLIVSILLSSCEKSVIPNYDIPKDYPTTYSKFSSYILAQMQSSYALKNKYMVSSLNEFGFCNYLDDLLDVGTPPLNSVITKSEATEIVKSFVKNNSTETGVNNPNDLSFYKVSSSTGYGGSIGWVFKTENQKLDTIEVMYSELIVHLTNREVTLCLGNWFPEIYIPTIFNVSQTKAKDNLNGKVVSHYTFGGSEYFVTISKPDLDKSTIHLKVLPKNNTDNIELRLCWQINIPGPVYYEIYVDVMTGEIIGQEPTIIS
jgi:Zn-dependent metalloprotease